MNLQTDLKTIQISLAILCTIGGIVGGACKFTYEYGLEQGKNSCQKVLECKSQNQDGDYILSGQCVEIIKGIMDRE